MRIRALDAIVDLAVVGRSSSEVIDLFSALRCEDAGKPAASFRLVADGGESELLEEGERIGRGILGNMLQLLISRLGGLAVDATDDTLVHASTVTLDGIGVMVTAPSGHGKSTMTARLLAAGAHLVAEDITAIGEDLAARTYHRPLGLAPTSVGLLGLAIEDAPSPEGGEKYLIDARRLGFSLADGADIRVVAICDRKTSTIERVTPAQALAKVLELGVAPLPDPARHLSRLAAVLGRSTCLLLGSSDLDIASSVIAEACATEVELAAEVEQDGERVIVALGTEVVILDLAASAVHHLNESAAAVWAALEAGVPVVDIANELGSSAGLVEQAMEALDAAGIVR